MANPRHINYNDVRTFMDICELKFEGDWQRDIIKHLCENVNSVLQGSRQVTGKTWCTGTVQAAR